MRRTGVGVQALRPLRGRASPEPGPCHRPDALNGHRRRSEKEDPEIEAGHPTMGLRSPGATDKQGSRLVRWAAVEAVQRVGPHTALGQLRDQIGARRGRNIGVVAAARELTNLVFYALRDGHVRRLTTPPATPAA
jgi:hypothetical protein